MIALDSNILVRLFVRDDMRQFEAAMRLVRTLTPDRPGFVARETVAEIVWVLGARYGKARDEIAGLLEDLLGLENIAVEGEAGIRAALTRYRDTAAGFADLMILAAARGAGCETLYTFDRGLAREDGATLLEAS